MKIQIISLRKTNVKNEDGYEYTYSPIDEPKTFDAFDINFVSLQNESLWRYDCNSKRSINQLDDLKTLKQSIKEAKKSMTIVCLPQNYTFCANYVNYNGAYSFSCKLKDMMEECLNIIKELIPEIVFGLKYEDSTTVCQGTPINAHFYFSNYGSIYKQLTKNIGAEHPTTLLISENLIITTLNLFDLCNNTIPFLIGTGIAKQESDVPKWVKQYNFGEDETLKNTLNDNNKTITNLLEDNKTIEQKLDENNNIKSILVETGDALVKQIFPMLEAMFDCDLKSFVDEKKQDFLIKKENVTFVGEIKGVTPNVKKSNISQTETHCLEYIEDLEENHKPIENVKGILIINHQREKELSQREPVQQEQINLAKKKNILIVETCTLLKSYELFLKKLITTEKIVSKFMEDKGLLRENYLKDEQ